MPSLMSKQRLPHYLCLGLSSLLLGSALIGCGSGESEAEINVKPPEVNVPKPKNLAIITPVELRNVVVKVYDNFDNTLVLEKSISTTTNQSFTLPYILNTNHLYRIEILSTPTTLIYDFISGQYQTYSQNLHALVAVNVSKLTQNILVNPSSEAIYQRALVRSGYLPTDATANQKVISALQLQLATQDVNNALLTAFNIETRNLEPSYQLNSFTAQDVALSPSIYANSFLSYGYLQQWTNAHPNNAFAEFTKSLSLDLSDGQLDAKKVRGDQRTFTPMFASSPDNIDPAKNTLINIANNQATVRDQFGASLKSAVLQLANSFQQQTLNPNGYALLQEKSYSANAPTLDSALAFRIQGAGDYRRAVGFSDTVDTCNGSLYACKQGITGINITNARLPSIEYLIGNYKDTSSGCQLNIRANGVIELIKGAQVYRSTLDADSTDNLLQVNKVNHEYLLNSSSTTPENAALEYTFVQVNIKANQVLSASAGVDNRKAPDQLQTTQLQCNFS